ncbi:Uncharacterised protein [Klebsiella pneumoniae]|nr:Uncharacterised protein [Klebsiella pneumoniae]VGI81556.1 Uncharacterised protein [Klebsiella pneumoniae]
MGLFGYHNLACGSYRDGFGRLLGAVISCEGDIG